MAIALFVCVIVALLVGYPIAFTLAGVSFLFIMLGILTGSVDASFIYALNSRFYGILNNTTLIAVPLFIFMGVAMQHSRIAEQLLLESSRLIRRVPAGLGITVVLVGMVIAASTGIVGATVVTMGLLALPVMLKQGYEPRLACGTICAAGTLGQIIPPSIVLILLGDVMSSAYQQAQLNMGNFSPRSVSIVDLFAGAVMPGLLLVGLYLLYLLGNAWLKPTWVPRNQQTARQSDHEWKKTVQVLFIPLILIVVVLGSIFAGAATPTEASAFGALGILLIAYSRGAIKLETLRRISRDSTRISCMVFMILFGASLFSLAFRGFGGDEIVTGFLTELPGGALSGVLIVMAAIFVLGFIIDFIEITLVVVPITAPALLMFGLDPIWLGVMIAINLQTSFLTPPFGFSLFYLRGVAPPTVRTEQIYAGAIPFIALHVLALLIIALWPELATWLPEKLN